MEIFILGFTISFTVHVVSAVILMGLEGWLPILTAVLLLMSFMGHVGLNLLLAMSLRETNKKEEKP